MRVAQFVSSLLAPLGGAEQYCLELSRWLRDQGHEVTLITGWISPDVSAQLEAEGIGVRVVPSARPYPPDRKGSRPAAVLFHALDVLGTLRAPRPVRRVLAEDWDLVHVHRVAGFGAALLRSTAAPVVFTVHDYALVDTSTTLLRRGAEASRPPLVQRLRTLLVNRAIASTHLVYPSARLRQKHERWGLRPRAHTTVLPHGWRLGADAIGAPAGPRDEAQQPVVFLFLGKLIDTKGVDLLLDAWGDGIPGAELWIAGSGPREAAVDAAAASGRVRKLGWLDAPARRAALASVSALVIPSIWPENFQLAAAEGVLAGLPILSTTVAAPPVVEPDVSGILVTPDAVAIRAGMVRLLDPALRSRLAAGARERARDLDFDVHGERVLAIYAEAGADAAGVAARAGQLA
ncbi:MAG: glycosyltransferase family 4 protein [Pseudolysinimonas sp.]